MRHPMDRRQRLTDGTRSRTFMRLLLLDDLITSYTYARSGVGLSWVDLDLSTRSGLLASRCRTSVRSTKAGRGVHYLISRDDSASRCYAAMHRRRKIFNPKLKENP